MPAIASLEDLKAAQKDHYYIYEWGSSIRCGLARPRSFVGGKPTQVAVSHGPGIQSCRYSGDRMLDA